MKIHFKWFMLSTPTNGRGYGHKFSLFYVFIEVYIKRMELKTYGKGTDMSK